MSFPSIAPLVGWLWAVFLTLLTLFGSSSTSRADGVEVRGKVVDAETGKPITVYIEQGGLVRDGRVEWGFSETRTETGNRDALFSMTIDWAGGHRMRIIAPGYAPQPVLTEAPPPGVKKLDVVVEMHRGREVTGTVKDADGKPVAGAAVFLVGKRQVNVTNRRADRSFGAGADEDKTVTRSETDARGKFTLTGSGEDAERVAVSAADVDFWVMATPDDVKAPLDIRLPMPGTLTIRYDIPGSAKDGEFFMQRNTWDDDASKGIDNIRRPKVANGAKLTLANLTPGEYWITRNKQVRVGNMGFQPMLDRQKITIKPGGSAEATFVRKEGAAIAGKVEGLDAEKISGAIVSIKPAKTTNDPMEPKFDSGPVGADGTFSTERLAPGEYIVVVDAYAKEDPNAARFTGITPPALTGTAKVVVPKEGVMKPITITLKPWARPARN